MQKSKRNLIIYSVSLILLLSTGIPSLLILRHYSDELAKDLASFAYSSAVSAYTGICLESKNDGNDANPFPLEDTEYSGTDTEGIGFKTMQILGKEYNKNKLIIVANKKGVKYIIYDGWKCTEVSIEKI